MTLELAIVLFLGAAVTISVAGWRLARLADQIADRTGVGEALAGALLLGATTSLPGVISTVVTASKGHPDFAFSHAMGGVAVQMTFLSIADLSYHRANLEHAAASVENVLQGAMLALLLSIVVLTVATPEFSSFGRAPDQCRPPGRLRLRPIYGAQTPPITYVVAQSHAGDPHGRT